MKRTVRDNRDLPHPKPVEKIALSDKGTRLRLVLVIVLVLVAVAAFVYGVVSMLGAEDGWTTIEAESSADINCGSEFVFQYRLGAGGLSATAEKKAVTALYTEAVVKAYRLFNNDAEGSAADGGSGADDVDAAGGGNAVNGDSEILEHNVRYLNSHPNEEIQVDGVLYRAFALCEEYGNRNLYLAPVYEQYDSLFYCAEDWETESFDPLQNAELAADFKELAAYARDAEKVRVELLGNNTVRLYVSEDYLQYARQEFITGFIDFYWMKNAFIADYVAELMIENGFTNGCLSSYDGFRRNLDDSETEYSLGMYDRVGNTVYPAAVMRYSGRRSVVCLRDFGMNSLDFQHYYELENGQIRTAYLDVADGLCRAAAASLLCYSDSQGCAELLLQMIPVYIADTFRVEKLPEYSVYCADEVIYHDDPQLVLTDLYADEMVQYKSSCVLK